MTARTRKHTIVISWAPAAGPGSGPRQVGSEAAWLSYFWAELDLATKGIVPVSCMDPPWRTPLEDLCLPQQASSFCRDP
uniref:Uncharacterized protein n=1 Tax=Knipowitschia caucasica TaxID=637954 RepID=A0AAV2LGY7_KNICA